MATTIPKSRKINKAMQFHFDTAELEDKKILDVLKAIVAIHEHEDKESVSEVVHAPDSPCEATKAAIVAEAPKRRGRRTKEEMAADAQSIPPATAADLFIALKQMDDKPEVPEAEEAPESPVEDTAALLADVRTIMYEKGHVWMRNVLEKHKKAGKTMADFSADVLKEIIANSDKYDEV